MKKQAIYTFIHIVLLIFFWSCKDKGVDGGGIIVPPMTEPPQVVDSEPDWSPDGKTIAYTHSGGQIWLLDLQSMTTTYLTDGFLPAWAPDGKSIAYVLNDDIHIIDTTTKQITRLTTWGSCFFPSWSPDGTKIAFDTNYGDLKGANAIWIMKADGSGKKDISQHGTGEWREPRWSRDGRNILHLRYIGIGFPELFLMDTSGTNPVRLTTNSFDDQDPVWSYDGTKIAWGSGGKDNSGIWIMSANGTNQKFVIKGGGYPSWSPDGGRIAFHKVDDSGRFIVLWAANADGSSIQQLTSPKK